MPSSKEYLNLVLDSCEDIPEPKKRKNKQDFAV